MAGVKLSASVEEKARRVCLWCMNMCLSPQYYYAYSVIHKHFINATGSYTLLGLGHIHARYMNASNASVTFRILEIHQILCII